MLNSGLAIGVIEESRDQLGLHVGAEVARRTLDDDPQALAAERPQIDA